MICGCNQWFERQGRLGCASRICFLFPNLKFSAQCPLFLLLPLFCFLFKVSTHDPTAKKLENGLERNGGTWQLTYVLFIE